MSSLALSILCTVLMVVAVGLELLTSSFGIFTLVALGLGGLSTWVGFEHSTAFGYVMAAVNLVAFPASLYVGIQFLKRSPMLLRNDIRAGVPPEAPSVKPVHALVGQEGRALTMLRPSGLAQFGDVRTDVVTEGKFVEPGAVIRVLRVDGTSVIVEEVKAKG